MSDTQTLGGFDMVLGLSERMINEWFDLLFFTQAIPNHWTRLISNQPRTLPDYIAKGISASDEDFKSIIERWHHSRPQNSSSIISGFNPLHWWESRDNDLDFGFGWDVTLGTPKVFILDRDSDNLILQITFKSGTLYHRPDNQRPVQEYSLDNAVFAFQVATDKIEIVRTDLPTEARAAFVDMVDKSSFREQDFRIEALFLHLGSASASVVENSISDFPRSMTTVLRQGVQAYFNSLVNNKETPYIMGYGVTLKQEQSNKSALFHPTAVGMSASFGPDPATQNAERGSLSACNYLMMVNHQAPPSGNHAGRLPLALPELQVDQSDWGAGVFAISSDSFQKYVDKFDQVVRDAFTRISGVRITQGFRDDQMIAEQDIRTSANRHFTRFTVTRTALRNNRQPAGIRLRYRIAVRVTLSFYMAFIRTGQITISSFGDHLGHPLNEPSSHGFLDFEIRSGTEGRFRVEQNFTEPVFAYNNDPNQLEQNIFFQMTSLISSLVLNIGSGNIVSDMAEALEGSSLQMTNHLNELDLETKANQIILPLGQTYTYNNLQYHPNLGILTQDITYAPIN